MCEDLKADCMCGIMYIFLIYGTIIYTSGISLSLQIRGREADNVRFDVLHTLPDLWKTILDTQSKHNEAFI